MYSGQWLAVVGFLPSIYTQAGLLGATLGLLTAVAAAVNMVGNMASGRLLQRGIHPSVLLAMVTIQSGASVAKELFPLIGPEGTTALRLGFSALVLWLVFRPWRALPSGRRDWLAIVTYGISLGGMNILFYLAIERIPLGIGVALEFTGPLAVALFSSRRKRDLLWVGCAIAGILLLLPDMRGADALDPVGVVMALAAASGWMMVSYLNCSIS